MPDWQFTYTAPSGDTFSWGPGTDVIDRGILGLDGFDQIRSSTADLPRGHGAVPGQHYLPAREPVFRMRVVTSDMTAVREPAMRALGPSIDVDGTLSWVRPGETPRLLFCRPLSVVWDIDRDVRIADPVVAFEAADPRMYAGTADQIILSPFTVTGGVDSPVNDVKDAESSGLDGVAENSGNAASPPVLTVYGPTSGTCTGVQVINRTSGVTADFDLDIGPGQILTVDMRAQVAATGSRVVDLSGTGRYGAWTAPREPLMIEPGSNVLRFTGQGTTTGMRAYVSWRDCWLT